jgi:hypothetical protein
LDEETLWNVFTIKRKVNELLVEFNDGPQCYSQNLNYKRKHYMIKKDNGSGYIEVSLDGNHQIKFCDPIISKDMCMMKIGTKIFNDRFKSLGIKSYSSYNNCEFVNLQNELCFQIIMSTSKYIFSVVYDKTMFTPEDVIDICGQRITHTDI